MLIFFADRHHRERRNNAAYPAVESSPDFARLLLTKISVFTDAGHLESPFSGSILCPMQPPPLTGGKIMKIFIKSVILLALLMLAMVCSAQKGAGDPIGISGQGIIPDLHQFEGTVTKIHSGPCPYTTGQSANGMHIMLEADTVILNIHLGPVAAVSDSFADREGEALSVTAFRTDKLPVNHYIAKEVILEDGTVIVLRDENLKPVWAGKQPNRKRRKS